jgi:hypothetical protein
MQIDGSSAGDVIGWMDINPKGEQIEIAGRAFAHERTDIEYALKVERIGKSGKTATNQSGRAAIAPGEVAKLSTTSVNVGAQDGLSILLTITRGGEIVATSAMQIGSR